MRFLADECLRVEIVAALRQAGHEVATVAPADTGASDEMVLARAMRERAILLTADKDFGKIAVARAGASPGVVLFRRSVADPAGAAARLLALVQERGDTLYGVHAVVTRAEAGCPRRRRPLGETRGLCWPAMGWPGVPSDACQIARLGGRRRARDGAS
jgi:predicted nuclease of predicted toxin-antitoxin system